MIMTMMKMMIMCNENDSNDNDINDNDYEMIINDQWQY